MDRTRDSLNEVSKESTLTSRLLLVHDAARRLKGVSRRCAEKDGRERETRVCASRLLCCDFWGERSVNAVQNEGAPRDLRQTAGRLPQTMVYVLTTKYFIRPIANRFNGEIILALAERRRLSLIS